MKIAVCSDVHLEFAPIVLENKDNVEVLILSGDICVAKDLMAHDDPFPTKKSKTLHEFFYNCCNVFPHVVYVAGNHEHYHGDFKYTLKNLKKHLKYLPNLQILDKKHWDYKEEYRFIGGTFWTDMNKEDPVTLYQIKGYMNDFRCVKNSNRMVTFKHVNYKTDENGKFVFDENNKMIEIGTSHSKRVSTFSPEDAVEDHKKMLAYLKKTLADTPESIKVVVVGHHAPSKLSTHPRYADEFVTNGAYSSDLSELMLDNPKIKLWTHGHTHEVFDYMVGSTRIVCNPRGYDGYEETADCFELKVMEI
jgi:DNA repair exonuclease SbcCD nuclease subunit